MIEFQKDILERDNLVHNKTIAAQRGVGTFMCQQNSRDKGHYAGYGMNASFQSGEA
ncbi:hypothetical protein [Nitrosovibrio sp. Nv4]|uniref:hypothetical protein n=1 Tax=Nitrosovibrio sp. Nv4 TaxID=1945880 RepID=UPI000BDD42ED|nr:hypothetical protein [Nitrosovibrio sp. Nv4]SOD40181.1 hypothetical protein SAMN06298226_0434 [Nitrosovibrio sp. Nv4]